MFHVYCYSERKILSDHDTLDDASKEARKHRRKTRHVVSTIESSLPQEDNSENDVSVNDPSQP